MKNGNKLNRIMKMGLTLLNKNKNNREIISTHNVLEINNKALYITIYIYIYFGIYNFSLH
jgi:hypothetical protein